MSEGAVLENKEATINSQLAVVRKGGMPRQVRIEYGGAVYHVMSRGNAGEKIYFDRQGYELFLKTLDEACERSRWFMPTCLCQTITTLLLETPNGNLVDGMRRLQ